MKTTPPVLFATRTQVVAYLVSEGKPENYAKAAVNEGFNFEQDGDTRDLCFREFDDEDFKPNTESTTVTDMSNSEFLPTLVTPEFAISMYNTFEEMFSVEGGAIFMDGEPMYDLQGNMLKTWDPDRNASIVRGYENGGNFD